MNIIFQHLTILGLYQTIYFLFQQLDKIDERCLKLHGVDSNPGGLTEKDVDGIGASIVNAKYVLHNTTNMVTKQKKRTQK